MPWFHIFLSVRTILIWAWKQNGNQCRYFEKWVTKVQENQHPTMNGYLHFKSKLLNLFFKDTFYWKEKNSQVKVSPQWPKRLPGLQDRELKYRRYLKPQASKMWFFFFCMKLCHDSCGGDFKGSRSLIMSIYIQGGRKRKGILLPASYAVHFWFLPLQWHFYI